MFGISATTAALVVAGTAVAATVYSADQQRKAINKQKDALLAAQDADARESTEADTNAQVAANAKLADANRRRRNSSLLASGGMDSTPTLGAPKPVAAPQATNTVLGGGA